MLSVMVATMLAMAAKDPLDAPRKAYSNCLVDVHNETIKKKQTVEEFTATATAACEKERKDFSDAVYKAERPTSKEADAQERAADEVRWMVEWIVDLYTGNLEEGTSVEKD